MIISTFFCLLQIFASSFGSTRNEGAVELCWKRMVVVQNAVRYKGELMDALMRAGL